MTSQRTDTSPNRRRPALPHHRADDFFVLRFPLLPFAEFAALGDGDVVARIRALFADPRHREALFISSPGVEETVQRWDELTADRVPPLVATLYKYLSRMTTRPSPFGAFAGYSVGRTAPETDFTPGFDTSADRRVVELSPSWLRAVVHSQWGRVRERSRWRRNPTARQAAEGIRYFERQVADGVYSYGLSEVEASPLILAALEAAAAGRTLDEIRRAVTALDGSVGEEAARQFVEDLVEAQLLVSGFDLPVTSLDPAADAVRLLREHGLEALAAAVEESAAALAELTAQPLGVPPDAHRRIAARLAAAAATDAGDVFNAKLVRSGTPELGADVIAEIDRAVALLHKIHPPQKTPLQEFAAEFARRFGTREVPLLDALDPETGISFPPVVPDSSPLIDGIPFRPASGEGSAEWLARDAALLNLVHDALRAGRNEIALTDEDVARLASGEPPPLPDTFAVQTAIAAPSQEALRRGDFRVTIEGIAGPSAARFFTRFSATDPVLLGRVREHIEDEERLRPDVLFAEVLHLPEVRHAVMSTRPAVRAYEIPLLVPSSLPEERQIGLDDLLVSVDGDSVLLRSRRLGRQVIPCMTTALNVQHERGIALYRFFGALTKQGRASSLFWDWGRLWAAARLPRVTAGRIVLSRESWRITEKEVESISGSDERIAAWCRERELPRFVRINGELTVDLSTGIGRATLADLARGGTIITELFPAPESLWFGGDRPFVHEIMLPYVSTSEPVRAPARPPAAESGRRLFLPGSEWLYAKLYAGPSIADRLLAGPIPELVERLRGEGAIDRWFFIRYSDPDDHLRLRFHGEAGALAGVVLPALHAAFGADADAGLIARIELATYDREVERYGGWEAIGLAEEIFHVDSETVVEILAATGGGDTERWHYAVAGVDRLLGDFGLPLEAKRGVVQSLRATRGTWFDVNRRFVRALGDRYRLLRGEVETAVKEAASDPVLQRRSQRLAPAVEELRRLEAEGRLTAPIAAMARSFLHMFLNRLFRASQNQHEYVVCDFLDRAYESAVMRSRSGERRSTPVTK